MPEIEIRPANAADLPELIAIDHSYSSEYVWQMERRQEEGQTEIIFRELQLPRSVQVAYPRSPKALVEDWQQRDGLLVALLDGEPVGYTSLWLNKAPLTAWMTDLVVARRLRRQGIGAGLVLAASEWAAQQQCRYLVLEAQPKNYAAIQLAHKLGFDFCGYNDRYFVNHDIGLFFARPVR